ncbi:MAG: AraC family transcriptional regulator [Arenicella sp.]|jgi:AraC-like DNA-binding protein|nr:AraC family transcriptional regulator [Arenicella sp.]
MSVDKKTQKLNEQGVDGWALDPDCREGDSNDTLRFNPEFKGASGYREIFSLDDGFQLVKSDVVFEKDTEFAVALDTLIKFQFRLEGSGLLHFNEHDDIPLHEFSGGVLLQPNGMEKFECYKSGEHERAVTLLVTPEYLRDHFTSQDQQYSSPLTFYLDTPVDDVFFSRLPMTPEIANAAQALYNPDVQPGFATLYRQSRAQELLIYCLELLSRTSKKPHLNLKSRDIECINKARLVLEADIAAPPVIKDLARDVGINESKLMAGFKQLYNQTLHDYLRSLRMETAKSLLAKTDLPITQVALEVGYDFSSNFTIAFKRHYGVTPSSIRKNRAIITSVI